MKKNELISKKLIEIVQLWHFSSILLFMAYKVSVSVAKTAAIQATKNIAIKIKEPHFKALKTLGY